MKAIMAVGLVVGLVATASARAETAWKIGASATVEPGTIGCIDRAVMEKAVDLMRQRDREAFTRFLMRPLMSGACKTFDDGGPVVVIDLSGSLTQVRERGDPDEYWVWRSFVISQ